MLKLIKKMSRKRGLPPGTLIHVGKESTEAVNITVIDYDETRLEEREHVPAEDCASYLEMPGPSWINVDGVHDAGIIGKIGTDFAIHPLVLEDILNTGQRPKSETFDEYIFIVLKMLSYSEESEEITGEQVSLLLGENYVISFQEKEGDVFNPVRDRIRGSKGRIRKMKADYLAYALLDAVVDNYFVILEKIGEKIEFMEEELVSNPTPQTLQSIHNLKRESLYLRKSIWPLREVINNLVRGESSLIHESTQIYLRDVYDHTIQVIDTVETLRDMISGMLDIYLSSVSNRMNEIMKVLTMFAAVFIPLTFMAGVYGMNFEFMPELKWSWSYPVLLCAMAAVGISFVYYFKKKQWL